MTKKTEETNELEQKTAHAKDETEQVYANVEAQRKQLEEKYKTKVRAAIFKASAEDAPCVAYFKSASTFTKMQCMDMAAQSPIKASRTLFDSTVIREESDPRVFLQDNDDDFYYLGAVKFCGELVTYARNTLKKK